MKYYAAVANKEQLTVEIQRPQRERRSPSRPRVRAQADLGSPRSNERVHPPGGIACGGIDRDRGTAGVVAVEAEPGAQIQLRRRGGCEDERRLRARDRRRPPAGVLGSVARDVERVRVAARA